MTGLISGLFISRCMTGKISDSFLNSDKLNFKMFLLNFRFEVFGLARQRHGITVRFSISCEKLGRITILSEYRQSSSRAVIWQKPLLIHFIEIIESDIMSDNINCFNRFNLSDNNCSQIRTHKKMFKIRYKTLLGSSKLEQLWKA